MKYNVAIVEDELDAAKDMSRFLEEFGRSESVEFTVSHFPDAEEFLRRYIHNIYDLVMMDIRMPSMDGMTAAEKLRQIDEAVPLVFVTSMVQFAVRGYSVDALDFIVKPVKYPAFELKMKRIIRAVKTRRSESIMINVDGAAKVIPANLIYYVEVLGHNLTYHTAQGDYTLRGKLSAVEQSLPKESFFRCSASNIINLRYVNRVLSEDVEVAGKLIRFSRGKKREFMDALSAYLGKGV